MRAGWVAATAVFASSVFGGSGGPGLRGAFGLDGVRPARAGGAAPRLEASGFVGVGTFGDSQLGNSWAPEQAPRTSAVLGARVGWIAAPALVRRGPLALSLGAEAELTLAPSFTGEAAADAGGRMSYFAPVFGWRAHALLRQPVGARGALALHAVLGAGGATVASSSPFMAKETDPLAYVGLGATYTLAGRWRLRVDGRQGLMPARPSGATRVSELSLGLATTFDLAGGRPAPARPPRASPDAPDAPDGPREDRRGGGTDDDAASADADTDTDGDGLPDRVDRCPREPETVNGVADDDGCPEPDPDGDGVVGAADACPLEAEDLDHFQDEDGCPDPDNDGDGIEDVRDACPGEPETRNGFADADGCPDAVPEAVARALAGAGAVRFDRGRARITGAARRALAPLLAALEAHRDVAVVVSGAPERAGDEDLAKRRAEAVKWYLVDQGIAEDRIDTAVAPTGGDATVAVKLR